MLYIVRQRPRKLFKPSLSQQMQPHALILVYDKVAHRLIRTDTYSYSNHHTKAIM